MFLFLDVISTIPEFHLIKDKKIINSIKILDENDQKLSDKIIPAYLDINYTHNLSKEITNLIITTGPGSYTALRVGASFIAGLSLSLNLPVAVISIESIYQYLFKNNKNIGIYFESSNNQKFFTYKKNSFFIHEKIENENFILPKFISCVFYNLSFSKFTDKKIKSKKFLLKQLLIENIHMLEFKKNLTIKPMYISNNSILN